ncbi:glutamate-1-semialdehyde 2,1-aminomutase [Gracilimonas sediminicola]|uniref:Glutamate-1-semialdehyde 2,1-aminomutase n=1 Tax=Gracilimonas sediminicola TaxID=2952158 RepID=A0A9X2L6E8_9BACT|nr:glutamate-1-semialdehyde 2,1-aminomutase [Gracilimonas sediminicola]MCP9292443.1 glutamate-1-semialdehyde 2,1-aminomutase [Gracilimonas sediminicola]
MDYPKSKELYERASKVIPGGVNSPVRAFNSVGGTPLFITRAQGSYLWDEEGNRYIDLISSWGPMLLGHAEPDVIKAVQQTAENSTSFGAPTRLEVEMAELITSSVPGVDKIRMVNSGTEATMSAIRVARGYTGKNKIIKFKGNYHGHGDSFLIEAGSGALTMGEPSSPGVTEGTAKDTLNAEYNNLDSVKKLVEANKDDMAAIILEPIAGNMGCIPPNEGFLEGLRALCDEHNIVLIFDEVMTGFRVDFQGAQKVYGVTADMVTYGKIIGAGLPVGAYGGKEEIMDYVAPTGPVYQAGTLSGNPLAMAAGFTLLKKLKDHPEVYDELEKKSQVLATGITKILEEYDIPHAMNRVGSMIGVFYCEGPVETFDDANRTDKELFGKIFHGMLKRGVHLPPSPFEAFFLANSLTTDDLSFILTAFEETISEIKSA